MKLLVINNDGGGIADDGDPLLVEDIQLVRQECSWAYVAFDDEAVAEFFDDQVDAGRHPEQFARIWVHTHPGDSATPSPVDEETFVRVFGPAHWAVMFILARAGETYARLRFNVGPGAAQDITTRVIYNRPFPAGDHDLWEAEYQEHVRQAPRRLESHLSWGDESAWTVETATLADVSEPKDVIDGWKLDPLEWEDVHV